MTYKASWDNLTKIVTAGVTVLYAGILVNLFISMEGLTDNTRYGVAALLILIYLLAYAFRPTFYEIAAGKLVIHRPFDQVVIDKNDVESVQLLPDDKLKWTFRTFGVGGVFGFYGKFYNFKIGHMTWYATRRNNAVLVQLRGGKKIVLTPDEPDLFAGQFRTPSSVFH
jgi:hypothetical protein